MPRINVTPLALWHDGETAVLILDTTEGHQMFVALAVLEREDRQRLLRTLVSATKVVGHLTDGATGMLTAPLAAMSPSVAEFPAESLIGMAASKPLLSPEVPLVPPENAVLIEAAIAAEAGRD